MGVDMPVEAEPHLRAVLETQPVVISRIAGDGTFLAVNEAGLSMLGAQALDQVLGTSLTTMVPAEESKGCLGFLERVIGGHRGSFEVDLLSLTGSRLTLELHGSAHPGAPDGITSALVSFRDVTESRRLEESLVEAAARQSEQEAAHDAERSRLLSEIELARKTPSDQFSQDEQLTGLERRLAELHEERSSLLAAHAEEVARLQDALADERRQSESSAAAVSQLDASAQQLAELRERHDALESERQQLLEMAGLLRSEAEARQQTVHELTDRLEALESERQQALEGSNALRLELDERQAQVASLTSRLEHIEAEHRSASETSAHVQRELESRTSLANELVARIEQLESEYTTLRESSESSLQAQQERYATDTDALRTALNDSLGEQARLAEAMRAAEEDASQKAVYAETLEQAHNARVDAMNAEHATRVSELEAANASRVAEVEALVAARQAELESARAAAEMRVAELEATYTAQIAQLEAARATLVAESEAALAAAAERTESALAAIQRAEETFGSERQRLEDALLAAVDGEKAARQALAAEVATRAVAERSHKQMLQAFERFAKDAGVSVGNIGSPAPAPKAATTTRELAERLNVDLPRRLGDGLSMSLLAASADAVVTMDGQAVADAIGVFADSRRMSMLSGAVTVELAEVIIDDSVGGLRGMSPGPYVLVVMNVDGPGAQQGFPAEIYDTADPRGWRELKAELQSARSAIVASGGQVWLTREGASILIVEFYLPREA